MRFVKENSGAVQIEEVGTNQLEINKEIVFVHSNCTMLRETGRLCTVCWFDSMKCFVFMLETDVCFFSNSKYFILRKTTE